MPPAAALSARRSRNIDWVEVVRSPEVAIRMVAVLRLIDLNRTFALCCANSHRRAVYVDQPARRTRPSLESAAVTFSRRRAYGPPSPAPAERHAMSNDRAAPGRDHLAGTAPVACPRELQRSQRREEGVVPLL